MVRRLVMFAAVLALWCGVAAPAHAWSIKKAYVITNMGTAALDTTSLWTADSSAILDTRQLDNLYLALRTDIPCRLAIQIKVFGDSASNTAEVASTDTTRYTVFPWRIATTSVGVDSTAYGPLLRSESRSSPASNEYVYNSSPGASAGTGNAWSGSVDGIYIPICTTNAISGGCLQADAIQIRWRVLECIAPGAGSTLVKTRIVLRGYGTP